MPHPHLLAVGGAHIDRRGRVSGRYVPAASNPGTLTEEVGGVVFNAARAAVQRGVAVSLVSVRGGDAAGAAVAEAIAQAGITDLSAVFLDRATASYTALLDETGELIAGLADMGLYEFAFPRQMGRSKQRAAVAAAAAVLTDANLPQAALERLVPAAAGKPLYAIAISPAKVVRLEGLLSGIACLFMNRAEARRLAGQEDGAPAKLAAALRSMGLASGVMTGGAGPVTGFDADGVFAIQPPAPRQVADVTGAGDALAGGTVAALMRGKPLREALREGMAAALLTVESSHAVAWTTEAERSAALALVPEAVAVA